MNAHPFARLRLTRLGAVASTLVLSAACTAGNDSPAASPPPSSVQSLVGDAACDDDAQCRTIGVGAKACGGPQAYIAWSTLRTDGAALRSQADREAERRRAEGEKRGAMSTCNVVPDPGAYCARPAGAAAGARGTCRLREGTRAIS
jgi:hypothetical protein